MFSFVGSVFPVLIVGTTVCSGLLTATVASRIHRAAQPALLYLVPFTLLPLLTMAYLKVRRRDETPPVVQI